MPETEWNLSVLPSPYREQTEEGSSCDSTVAPSQNGARTVGSSWASTAGSANTNTFMPLCPELEEQLIGPLGVLGTHWVLPPWCERMKDQLHARAEDVAFACNSGNGCQPDAFLPLCYTGSFGKVHFFWPKLDNTLGLLPGTVVAIKYQDILTEHQQDVDREVDLLRECAGAFVVPLYMVARHGRESWMVMPFVGYNLRTTIMQQMSDVDVASAFLQIAQGVKEMHDKGVLHRDLKPENVLVARSINGLHVVLADLGHACGGVNQWHCDNFATTIEYAAPEIWEHGLVPADQRDSIRQKKGCSLADVYCEATDIWAVTIILLQLVLHTVNIPGVLEGGVVTPCAMYMGVANLARRVEELIAAAGYLPEPVKAILRVGLQKDPRKRLGPNHSGIGYIVGLAQEWDHTCKSNSSNTRQADTAKVMECFNSTANEHIFQLKYTGQTPSSFEPPPTPPRQALLPSFLTPWKRTGCVPWVECSGSAQLSPGSMV